MLFCPPNSRNRGADLPLHVATVVHGHGAQLDVGSVVYEGPPKGVGGLGVGDQLPSPAQHPELFRVQGPAFVATHVWVQISFQRLHNTLSCSGFRGQLLQPPMCGFRPTSSACTGSGLNWL